MVEALSSLCRVTDPHQLDCEAYHRLVVTARNVAVARPHNLVKYVQILSEVLTYKYVGEMS